MNKGKVFIKRIEITNFRSIRRVMIDASSYNAFVGLNDAGKSNLLKALNLFFNGQTDYLQDFNFSTDFSYLFPKKAHHRKEIKIKVTFSIPSGYQDSGDVIWEKNWRISGSREDKIEKVAKNGKKEELSQRSRVPSTLRQVKFRYIPAVKSREYYKGLLSDLYDSVSSSLDSPLKNSIASFSEELKNYTQSISENVLSHLGITSELSMPNNLNDIFRALRFITSDKDRNLSVDLVKRGDGIQARHIPFILKYIADKDQKSRPKGTTKITTIWGFEEPENGLELSKAFDMAEDLHDYSEEIQLFVTTHSPAFYLNKDKSNSKVFYVSRGEENEGTQYTDGNSDISKSVMEKMGLMPLVAPFIKAEHEKYSALKKLLDDGAFIDRNTILVEGKYDYEYLKLAIEKYSKDNLLKKMASNELIIYTEDGEGGCGRVVDLAKSWEYLGYKSKLYVIFDKDNAGTQARRQLKKFITNFWKERSKKAKNKTQILNTFWEYPEDVKLAMHEEKIVPQIEVEHLLSSDFWKLLLKNEYCQEKGAEELIELLKKNYSINKAVSESISELEKKYPHLSHLLRYDPKDDKKRQIFNLAKKELDDPQSRILTQFKPTIEKLESYFN